MARDGNACRGREEHAVTTYGDPRIARQPHGTPLSFAEAMRLAEHAVAAAAQSEGTNRH